ncbi:ribonuclease Z [Tepidibacillus marianensis]|uniref:ribonuclease Z n=1 Tax=Tepidibacillus marianensis TaxID=3131995 RepID=UPI0030CD3D74
MLDVCLLGCGGTMPIPNRWLTSLLVRYHGKMILIDSGEGTQVVLKKLGWGLKSIDMILFTHYHADHIAGLPGLLLTIGNAGRTKPLVLVGPKGLVEVVKGLTVITPQLLYNLQFIELIEKHEEFSFLGDLRIHALAVEHSIPCYAFQIEIRRGRKFSPQKAKENQVPMILWKRLQQEESVESDGIEYTPDMVLGEKRKGLKICYVTDTRPIDDLVEFVAGAELLIAEGMYASDEYLEKAEQNKHMLFCEAAWLARNGNIKELWLTHFSPSLPNPEEYIENASAIFTNTQLGEERKTKTLYFSD